jgi:hypothetical protein
MRGRWKNIASAAEIRDEEPAASMALLAGYGALRRSIGNEGSPLWEWLPATIIAARCRSHRKTYNFIGRAHQQVEILRAYGFKHNRNPR